MSGLTVEEIEKRIGDSYELPNNVLKRIPEPLVSIRSSTYNHGSYIKQCIEGILMQKTNFPFEYIIGEDCSTDETRNIVFEYARKYPDIIRVITADYNVGSKANGRRCIRACRGKYMAICEGDDYWTDPLKLQKQVDFLEANPEFGMCYTQCKRFNQKHSEFEKNSWGGPYESFEKFWRQNCIPTLTAVYRKDLYFKYKKEVEGYSEQWLMGDYPMWLWFSHESKIKFVNEITGVYRVLEDSASHSKSVEKNLAFLESSLEVKKYFNDKFNYGKSKIYFERSHWFIQLRSYSLYKQYRTFARTWINGIIRHPVYLGYKGTYQYILFFLLPHLTRKRI